MANYNFNISSFFKNSNSGVMGSFDFSEYAAVKNGSYRKLVKAHYKNQNDAISTKKDKTDKTDKSDVVKKYSAVNDRDKTGLTKMKKEADSLKSAASALNDTDLFKETNGSVDMDKITSAVKSFAKAYNSAIDQTGEVSSDSVSTQASFMKNLSKTMSNALSKVGVTVGTDGKMTVDEDTLKKADVKDMKNLFTGKHSYAAQVADHASAISSAALRSASTYSSAGTLNNNLSSMFSDWI